MCLVGFIYFDLLVVCLDWCVVVFCLRFGVLGGGFVLFCFVGWLCWFDDCGLIVCFCCWWV